MPSRLFPLFKFNEEQIAALRRIAPEAFRDGALDFGALCEAFGDALPDEDDTGEHYGLQWSGKRQAKRAASLAPASLAPASACCRGAVKLYCVQPH